MNAYAVRLKGCREVVGLYCASNPADLRRLVDEVADVRFCEYTRLGCGGIYFADTGTPRLDEDGFTEDGAQRGLDDGALTEGWLSGLVGAKWKPLKYNTIDM